MLTITGKPVYGAISIGPLALFHRNTISTAVRTITDPEAEVQRLLEDGNCRSRMLADYAEVRERLGGTGASDAVAEAMVTELHKTLY